MIGASGGASTGVEDEDEGVVGCIGKRICLYMYVYICVCVCACAFACVYYLMHN